MALGIPGAGEQAGSTYKPWGTKNSVSAVLYIIPSSLGVGLRASNGSISNIAAVNKGDARTGVSCRPLIRCAGQDPGRTGRETRQGNKSQVNLAQDPSLFCFVHAADHLAGLESELDGPKPG